MFYELNHFGIVVRDLEQSLAFYQGGLGARVVFRGAIRSSETDVVYLQMARGLIELLHRRQPAPGQAFGITHIAFMSDDLDADYRALVDSGSEPLAEPKVAGTGVGRLAFVRDPNGARVELLQREVDFRTEPGEDDLVRSFDHYSVRADDLAPARDFYQRRLGMRLLTERTRPQARSTTLYLTYGSDVLELLHLPTPGTGDIFGHFALGVDSLTAAVEALAAQGVRAEPGIPGPGAVGGGGILALRDPDGVEIQLVERAALPVR